MSTASRMLARLRSGGVLTMFGELVLIVVGILIALAVDGWIQDRGDRQVERESLELLAGDLGVLLEQIQEFGVYQDNLLEAAGAGLRILSTESVVPRDEALADALQTLIGRRTLKLPRAAYEELVGTGTLRLIEDRGLRSSVVRFYQELARDEAVVTRNNEAFTDELFVRFFVGQGLIVPRPIHRPETVNIRIIAGAMERFAEEMEGEDLRFQGRLWDLRPEDPEWARARAILSQLTLSAALGAQTAEQIEARAQALVDRIESRLGSGG